MNGECGHRAMYQRIVYCSFIRQPIDYSTRFAIECLFNQFVVIFFFFFCCSEQLLLMISSHFLWSMIQKFLLSLQQIVYQRKQTLSESVFNNGISFVVSSLNNFFFFSLSNEESLIHSKGSKKQYLSTFECCEHATFAWQPAIIKSRTMTWTRYHL